MGRFLNAIQPVAMYTGVILLLFIAIDAIWAILVEKKRVEENENRKGLVDENSSYRKLNKTYESKYLYQSVPQDDTNNTNYEDIITEEEKYDRKIDRMNEKSYLYYYHAALDIAYLAWKSIDKKLLLLGLALLSISKCITVVNEICNKNKA